LLWENGEVIAGEPNFINRISETGEELWRHYFWTLEYRKKFWDMFTTANGDVICTGYFANSQLPNYDIAGASGYICRINDAGELLWERRIADPMHCNTPSCFNFIERGYEAPSGDLLFTGRIRDTLNGGDIWILKTDANGCREPDCGEVQFANDPTLNTQDRKIPQRGLAIFPNPAQEQCTITAPAGANPFQRGTLVVYGTDGRVQSRVAAVQLPYTLETERYSAGLYTLVFQPEGRGAVIYGRLVVR
jgi:hypothetical protein